MRIVLLDTITFGDTDLSSFDALGEVVAYQKTLPEELDERIANAEVIVYKQSCYLRRVNGASKKS